MIKIMVVPFIEVENYRDGNIHAFEIVTWRCGAEKAKTFRSSKDGCQLLFEK
jgi:hypothetical protein